MKRMGYVIAFVFGVTISACATSFPWRYYSANIPDRLITQADVGKSLADLAYSEGILRGKLGKDGWPARSLDECKPDPQPSPGASAKPKLLKCITMLDPDFYSLKADDEKCHAQLAECQKGQAPQQ